MIACPACGKETPEGFPRCAHCGAELATPEAAREERKVVSVLFADLVGFTSKAERLDPEDVRATLSPYYARLRDELQRHGGTVEKFIGDAVMAVFGAPVAHEDDPERAVRAALAIQDRVGDESRLQVRIAVTTGEALVSLGARPSEGEGMAAGDVVNTAARLQNAAPVNGILVDETTYRATRDRIAYVEAEPVAAKGKAEPVVSEAVAAFQLDRADRILESLRPLIGLAAEGEGGDRSERFAAWRQFFEALAEQRPTVLVFEDLHWADDDLLDFVDHLVDWGSGVPLLVVCTARPELLERRAGWGGGKPNALTLSISPLSDEHTARL